MSTVRSDRRNFIRTTAAGMAVVGALPATRAIAANEELRVAVVGAGGRGTGVAAAFAATPGVRLVMVADPDSGRANKLAAKHDAVPVADMRKVFDSDDVDAVVITTCNHWHCLAAIWALQAGKHVYVEKPLSHTQWEGRQLVEAARKSGLVCTIGTQQRSDPMQAEAKQFLHQDKGLGKIEYVQANRLGRREAIGRRATPLTPPAEVDYNLWLGPAAEQAMYRDNLHYDWHWDFNTGSGEMGNWGVHILDDIRNVAYQDSVSTPSRIVAAGGRVAWNDGGNTPNVHYAVLETDSFPTLMALSNLADQPDGKGSWNCPIHPRVKNPGSGYVVVCEGGYYCGQRQAGKAYDKDGKVIRTFKGGNIVPLHVKNFVESVLARDPSNLNVSIEEGHNSTGWCNLANVAFQVGRSYDSGALANASDVAGWSRLVEQMESQLKPFGVNADSLSASAVLTHDPKTERFVGNGSEAANAMLKRTYRKGFEVPEIVSA
ncbi:4-carboxy-2-hydroxymuconate-6-semialdehyde dehydrogenase [Roseimaritima multifibrata]|uniref:4-carboxy-2-hydroxymuconate-6-semialdehyde dehydrogenase n=1 Tax=Roseimaritima multifibrata TaxID=1930274 RepID=A0A517MFR1_9BACT|nr:Gfo/Idh/MocA family oxidoreductase [Roseimaritima multifibrata]QDS93597.1 4-carboxy-2-hydroxymuconate-6-semialdehyde dehydrogenase [Roseimaritima multifibrata]